MRYTDVEYTNVLTHIRDMNMLEFILNGVIYSMTIFLLIFYDTRTHALGTHIPS